ncbi:MAG: hypothetical protein ACK4M3_05335 [Pyrobaculum sp.]
MRWLFFVGLFLIFAGVGLLVVVPFFTYVAKIETAAVGCVVVFFVPVCFGAGTSVLLPWVLAMAAALLLVATILQWLLWRRGGEKE